MTEEAPVTALSVPEQVALMETIGATPLEHVATGTVHVPNVGRDRVMVQWTGVAIIPRAQLDAVLRAVAAEHAITKLDEDQTNG